MGQTMELGHSLQGVDLDGFGFSSEKEEVDVEKYCATRGSGVKAYARDPITSKMTCPIFVSNRDMGNLDKEYHKVIADTTYSPLQKTSTS